MPTSNTHNGSTIPVDNDTQITIDRIDLGTGWVCFQAGNQTPPSEALPGYLSQTLCTWLQRNPAFKVRPPRCPLRWAGTWSPFTCGSTDAFQASAHHLRLPGPHLARQGGRHRFCGMSRTAGRPGEHFALLRADEARIVGNKKVERQVMSHRRIDNEVKPGPSVPAPFGDASPPGPSDRREFLKAMGTISVGMAHGGTSVRTQCCPLTKRPCRRSPSARPTCRD